MNIKDFVSRVQVVTGESVKGLHEPSFEGNEKQYLEECIDSGFVSSIGSFVSSFEDSLRDFVGAKNAIAVVNGTTALHLALIALGVRPGDEVLVPALSFVATANAVTHAGAFPHFVDVDDHTWGVDPDALRRYLTNTGISRGGQLLNQNSGRPITALVPMHTLGQPSRIAELRLVADEFGLVMVEDAAESLGSYVGDQHTGLFGAAGVFSFNGNKTITTGGGGAIVTDDSDLAGRIKHLSTTARIPHPFEFGHDAVGYNYRMPNLNAALGLAQMEQLPGLLERQRVLHDRYVDVFRDQLFGEIHSEQPGTTSNYWLQSILLPEDAKGLKPELIEACLDNGIVVRPLWKPLNTLAPYSQHPSADTPVTWNLYERVICLPSSPSLIRTSA